MPYRAIAAPATQMFEEKPTAKRNGAPPNKPIYSVRIRANLLFCAILSDTVNTPVFAAVLDGVLVGYCFCIRQVQTAASMQKISTLYIDDLCVDAAMRGRGIGKVLYDYAVEYARENGYYNLTLNVWSCNESALRFYEKCGLLPQKIGMEMPIE